MGGHVPGATLVPVAQRSSRVHELPKDMPVYLICASGNRSLAMTNVLVRAGYDAYLVIGGTCAWTRAGPPVVMGSRRNAA